MTARVRGGKLRGPTPGVRVRFSVPASLAVAFFVTACASPTSAPNGVVRTEHQIRVTSSAPGFAGQQAQIYLREVAPSSSAPRGARPVVLFVHASGTPAEVSFDSRRADYSWLSAV